MTGSQLERLLDLYLVGDFPKDMVVKRKNRLESTIGTLEKERTDLIKQLDAQKLTQEQLRTLQDFATRIAGGLEHADQEFAVRRQLTDNLDLQVMGAVEAGQKVARARCVLVNEALLVDPSSTKITWPARGHTP